MDTREFTFHNAVESHLLVCPHLNKTNVSVRTHGRNVSLSGSVGSYFEKQMAQEALRQIEGVETIDNALVVDWNESRR